MNARKRIKTVLSIAAVAMVIALTAASATRASSSIQSLTADGKTFQAYFEDHDGKSWLLIGRGREGWEFDTDGQGSVADVSQNLKDPAGFAPACYSDAIMNDLLSQAGLGMEDVEVRLSRASTPDGNGEYQDIRWRDFDPADNGNAFTWNFEDSRYSDITIERVNAPTGLSGASIGTGTGDSNDTWNFDPDDDDANRIFTKESAVHSNIKGFSYGKAVAGVDTATSFMLGYVYDDINGWAFPYTEVYIEYAGDPTLPTVDAGDDMITWSGQAVPLDPNVVNRDVTPLTYLWSANDPCAVFDPSADVNDPTVTITKPALTLTGVTIVNPGFEDPVLADGGWETDPLGWTDGYYDVTAPTVWVVGDSDSGVYNPTAADGYDGVAPEGDNVMFATSGAGYDQGMNQVLSATLQANTQYDLSALVGNPFLFNGSTTTGDYRIELLAGGVVLESDTGASPVDDTTWTTAGLTYNSGDSPAQLGEALEIRLLEVNFTNGYGVDFDDVKLTAEGPTPDPYTVTLTLAVNNEGEPPENAVADDLTIDVYDDACQMARLGKGLAEDNPGDFDGNCITDFVDLAMVAGKWLASGGLGAPQPKKTN